VNPSFLRAYFNAREPKTSEFLLVFFSLSITHAQVVVVCLFLFIGADVMADDAPTAATPSPKPQHFTTAFFYAVKEVWVRVKMTYSLCGSSARHPQFFFLFFVMITCHAPQASSTSSTSPSFLARLFVLICAGSRKDALHHF